MGASTIRGAGGDAGDAELMRYHARSGIDCIKTSHRGCISWGGVQQCYTRRLRRHAPARLLTERAAQSRQTERKAQARLAVTRRGASATGCVKAQGVSATD